MLQYIYTKICISLATPGLPGTAKYCIQHKNSDLMRNAHFEPFLCGGRGDVGGSKKALSTFPMDEQTSVKTLPSRN